MGRSSSSSKSSLYSTLLSMLSSSALFQEFPDSVPDSLISELVTPDERVILLFGKTKIGKTRLVNYEAAKYGKALMSLVEVYVLETNQRTKLVSDIIAMYGSVGVPVSIYMFSSTYHLFKHLKELYRSVKKAKEDKESADLTSIPRVLVVDSISAIINELETSQGLGVRGEGHQPLLVRTSAMVESIMSMLSTLVRETYLNGIALVVAHSTKTWTEKPYPQVSWLNEKVRYLTKGDYSADAHIYVTDSDRGKELCGKTNCQALVLALARNIPPSRFGAKVCFKMRHKKITITGTVSVEETSKYTKIAYRPEGNKRFEAELIYPEKI